MECRRRSYAFAGCDGGIAAPDVPGRLRYTVHWKYLRSFAGTTHHITFVTFITCRIYVRKNEHISVTSGNLTITYFRRNSFDYEKIT